MVDRKFWILMSIGGLSVSAVIILGVGFQIYKYALGIGLLSHTLYDWPLAIILLAGLSIALVCQQELEHNY